MRQRRYSCEVIRHKVLVEERRRRQVAGEMGVSRNTVRHYREVAEPGRVERLDWKVRSEKSGLFTSPVERTRMSV